MRVAFNYEDDDDDEGNVHKVTAPSTLPNEWEAHFSKELAPQLDLFRATVGDAKRLYEYFPHTTKVSEALASIVSLANEEWFAGAIPDWLAEALMAEAIVKGGTPAGGFSYGDAPEEGAFSYGDEPILDHNTRVFVVRFSRRSPHYACLIMDPQRGLQKRLIRKESETRFRFQGREFSSLGQVVQHLTEQGYVSIPACQWRTSLPRVLDEAWESRVKAECKTEEERVLLSTSCYYGKADDSTIAQQFQEAGNPASFCIRDGSSAGTLTLCVCKPLVSGGSNAKFPHYFKYSLKGTAVQGLVVQGWKEVPAPPTRPVSAAELVTWLDGAGYKPFSQGKGCRGSRKSADPNNTGCATLRQLTGISSDALVWYGRPGDDLSELLREAAGADSQVASLRQTLLSTLHEISGSTGSVRLIDHGPLVLASVPFRSVWLRTLLQLVRRGVYFQEPLGGWDGAVSLITLHGATLDVVPCREDARTLLNGAALPPMMSLNRSLLTPACIVGAHRGGLSRSRVLDLLVSGNGSNWSQCVALLGLGQSSLVDLASSLVEHHSRLSGLEARQAAFVNGFQEQLSTQEVRELQDPLPTQCPVIPEERIHLETQLGGGNFGQVWSAKLAGRVPVAVKRLLETGPALEEEILREAALLNQIRHPGVLQLLGVSRARDGTFLIVMELMQNSLSAWLSDQPFGSVPTRLCIARDVAVALAYCHLLGVLHRDIAARNVLLSGSNPVRVKLCDFGLGAECKQVANSEKRFPISVPWAAPEALKYVFSVASDTWSYAVLLAEILSSYGQIYKDWDKSTSPFEPGSVPAFFAALKTGKRISRPEMCPESVYQVMLRCWTWEPKDRASLDQVVDVLDREIGQGDLMEQPPSDNSAFVSYEVSYVEI